MSDRLKIIFFASLCSLATSAFVTLATLIVYERSYWAFELSLNVGTTVFLTFPISAYLIAKIYENRKLSEELQRLLNRDRLTDVATRDHFFDQMSRSVRGHGVSLMVDIDHFKGVNDRFGHLAGDEVIQHVAGLLKAHCRPTDMVCRFGGEEFIVFLSEMTLAEGADVAERMRRAIADQDIVVAGVPLRVTVSIGAAALPQSESIEAAIRAADAALYRAKRGGRNQTCLDNAAAA